MDSGGFKIVDYVLVGYKKIRCDMCCIVNWVVIGDWKDSLVYLVDSVGVWIIRIWFCGVCNVIVFF